jgi:hypothetical protein
VIVLFLTTTLVGSFTLTPYSGLASTENNNTTLIEPEASQGMATQTPPLLLPAQMLLALPRVSF